MRSSDPSEETWLDLEKLAARIYGELESGSSVRHDVALKGTLTRVPRQIDVLIENEEHGTRVVVDCKDWAKRVSAPDAHAFAGLLEDVEATGGVLICNRGFSKATANLAKAKGFKLARLHDVESRKWQLDVRIPIVWTRLWLVHLTFGIRARLEKGDEIATDQDLHLLKDGAPADITGFFEGTWNRGDLHLGQAGEGELTTTLDWERTPGHITKNVAVSINYRVGASSKLGYVSPAEARGIFDEETQSFSTVHFNVGETLKQEPEGGWQDIHDPVELAIRYAGTVVSMDETTGVKAVTLGAVESVRGADARTAGFAWSRRATRGRRDG